MKNSEDMDVYQFIYCLPDEPVDVGQCYTPYSFDAATTGGKYNPDSKK